MYNSIWKKLAHSGNRFLLKQNGETKTDSPPFSMRYLNLSDQSYITTFYKAWIIFRCQLNR